MGFDKVYAGLRVVDLSQGVAGPYCGMMLAQHGAEVIKVEPPEGDWSRGLGKVYGPHCAYSIPTNLGKRSIALDLKSEQGREIVDRMVQTADIFIEGFRPGVIAKLGFSWERLSARDPELIYAAISGFGQTGPLSRKPAMDPVLQAFVGSMEENVGMDGIPHRTPNVFFDMATGMYTLHAISAALLMRANGQGGRRIETSLMQAAANITAIRLLSRVQDGPYQAVAAPSGTFKTSDGWIQVVAVKDHEFKKACAALGMHETAADPRYQQAAGRGRHQAAINGEAAEILKTRTSAEWNAILTEGNVQNEVVQSYTDFVHHPHTEETGLISWLTQAGHDTPWPVPNPPNLPRLEPGDPKAVSPTKGQHSREILEQFGYTETEMRGLFDAGIVMEQ